MERDVPTILVIGQKGQLGFELMRALQPLGRVIGLDRTSCDLSNAVAIAEVVSKLHPHVIVNAAAYTAVDKAESDRDVAFNVNAKAVGVLALAAANVGALLVHYSTDYVFSGAHALPYSEKDATDPINVYGESKLAGEQAITQVLSEYLIFRTTWVFGAHGANFAKTMLKLAAERDILNVIADQIGAPTSAALIADVSAHVIGRYLRQEQDDFRERPLFPFGTYNLTAKGETSWHGYATKVIEVGAAAGLALKTTPDNVKPISTKQYPTPAKRPANSRLACQKLESTFGIHLPHWTVHVETTVKLIAELKS